MNPLNNEKINYLLTKIVVCLYNFSYAVLSSLAVRFGKGVHPKHRILKYHEFFLEHISSKDCVIDIGAGSGLIAYEVSKKAKNVVGIEIDINKVKQAKKIHHRRNLKFIQGDATVYPFKEKFDAIILSNVLEHIEKRIDFLKSLHKISDNILLRVPLITRDWLPVYLKSRGFEYRLDKTHFIEYTIDNLKKELAESRWKISSYQIYFGEIWGVVKPA